MPTLEEVITIKDIRFDKTTFFDLRIENVTISIEEYYLLPKTLATLDFIVPEDLDIDIFVTIKNLQYFNKTKYQWFLI